MEVSVVMNNSMVMATQQTSGRSETVAEKQKRDQQMGRRTDRPTNRETDQRTVTPSDEVVSSKKKAFIKV